MGLLKAGSTIWRWLLRVLPGLPFLVSSWRLRPERAKSGATRFWGEGVELGEHVRGEVEASDDALGTLGGKRTHATTGEHLADGAGIHTSPGTLDNQAGS